MTNALCFRRRANKSTRNGTATEASTNRRADQSELATYEQANEVTGDDNNSGLESAMQTKPATEAKDVVNEYAEAATFSAYDTTSPASQEVSKDQPSVSSQIEKKLAAQHGEHGDAEKGAEAGEGSGGVTEEDKNACVSTNDITLVDNALYANVSSDPSSSVAAAGQTPEPIDTCDVVSTIEPHHQ